MTFTLNSPDVEQNIPLVEVVSLVCSHRCKHKRWLSDNKQ